MIYIYSDGVFTDSHLMLAVQAVTDSPIKFCTSYTIANGCLDDASLLIMPGGADIYYCEKLNGNGNQKIQEFVQNGGAYLGICAGAYYACSALDWAHGEISGSRELGFYSGKATGPVMTWIEKPNDIYSGTWIYGAEIETFDKKIFLSQYNGGPIFDESGCDIIARYTELDDEPAAVISGTFGQGKYILSSPHIEKFGHLLSDGLYRHLNNSYNREKEQTDKLLKHEKAQKEFFQSIIERLL